MGWPVMWPAAKKGLQQELSVFPAVGTALTLQSRVCTSLELPKSVHQGQGSGKKLKALPLRAQWVL